MLPGPAAPHQAALQDDPFQVSGARRHLEDGRLTLDETAERCGFGSGERMRKSFARVLGVGPGAYRERFRKPRLRRSA